MNRKGWPLWIVALSAAVAIWAGWVKLGALCGFGEVAPLPGITGWHLNAAITLPAGIEAYGAYAIGVWQSARLPEDVRRFGRRSAIGALTLGASAQVISHLLAAAHASRAPWPVVVLVSCVPVVTLGFAAALTHLIRSAPVAQPEPTEALTVPVTVPEVAPTEAHLPVADALSHETAGTVPDRRPVTQPKRPARDTDRTGQRDRARRLVKANPGISAGQLAEAVGVSRSTAGRWVKEDKGVPDLAVPNGADMGVLVPTNGNGAHSQ